MDLRKQRTKNSIINAFIQLRAKKPLEKITVKELAELAYINKATFYTYYQDIYDLSEQLEDEAITNMLNDIPHPEYLITKPNQSVKMLLSAIYKQGSLFQILFSDTRQGILLDKLDKRLKEKIYLSHPEYKETLDTQLILSVLIYGNFYTFLKYQKEDENLVINTLGKISECLVANYDDYKELSDLSQE